MISESITNDMGLRVRGRPCKPWNASDGKFNLRLNNGEWGGPGRLPLLVECYRSDKYKKDGKKTQEMTQREPGDSDEGD